MTTVPIPSFVNRAAGSAPAAYRALADDARFQVSWVEPRGVRTAVAAAIDAGARRVLVSGGDGTIAAAAAALAGRDAELAIIPGGTLNHFARDHGIPTALPEAIEIAAAGQRAQVDVGFVNDRLFLNTSSVGAYVAFVRQRERLERWLGYRLASFLAGLRVLGRVTRYSLALELEGVVTHYHTPLVFVGVGERELALPKLGSPVDQGRPGLHTIVVSGRARARLLTLALAAAAAGVDRVSRTPHLDSFVLQDFSVEFSRRTARVAVDGEVVNLATPLRYRLDRGTLTIIVPHVGSPVGADHALPYACGQPGTSREAGR
jgi:diacylglycerol kinase family enzyme